MKTFDEFVSESSTTSSKIQDILAAKRKPKDDYDFSDLETKDDKRKKAGGVTNKGTYGSKHKEVDEAVESEDTLDEGSYPFLVKHDGKDGSEKDTVHHTTSDKNIAMDTSKLLTKQGYKNARVEKNGKVIK